MKCGICNKRKCHCGLSEALDALSEAKYDFRIALHEQFKPAVRKLARLQRNGGIGGLLYNIKAANSLYDQFLLDINKVPIGGVLIVDVSTCTEIRKRDILQWVDGTKWYQGREIREATK